MRRRAASYTRISGGQRSPRRTLNRRIRSRRAPAIRKSAVSPEAPASKLFAGTREKRPSLSKADRAAFKGDGERSRGGARRFQEKRGNRRLYEKRGKCRGEEAHGGDAGKKSPPPSIWTQHLDIFLDIFRKKALSAILIITKAYGKSIMILRSTKENNA